MKLPAGQYLRYKKYAGENSSKPAEDQYIHAVVGNWSGEALEVLSFQITKSEKFGLQYFVNATSKNNANQEIRILLEKTSNQDKPFEYSGWIHSDDGQLNKKIESSLKCSVYDGEAN